MSCLQTYYHFKLNFQKLDQHTESKWLIHGTNRHKAWNSPVEYPSREYKLDINESKGKCSIKENVQGRIQINRISLLSKVTCFIQHCIEICFICYRLKIYIIKKTQDCIYKT